MVSVLLLCPLQLLWFLGGHLDFLCCDPGGGAFLGWSGLPPQHFDTQCPHLVTFGTTGIMHWTVCSASWVLLGAVGTVLGGCRLCVTMAAVAGVDHPPFVLADCVHRFGAVGDLFSGMLDSKVVHCNVSQLVGGVLNGLAICVPRSFTSWQYAQMIWQCSLCSQCSSLIISQWSISVLMHAMRSWGPLPAWLLSLQVLQDAHGCWHHLSCSDGFGRGKQKLLPWLLSVLLCCV